jgi:hypothetical protein
MHIIKLYKYTRWNGKTSTSPRKLNKPHTVIYRLVADEGKVLTDGIITTPCVDVENVEGWSEIDESKNENEEKEEI